MSAIAQAFNKDESLYKKIVSAISAAPEYQPLFEDIAAYHLRNAQPSEQSAEEPAAKKRKLANGSLPIHSHGNTSAPALEVKDISFSIPQRKKLNLNITNTSLYATSPSTNEVEFGLPTADIQHALWLPLPEKAQKQYNCIFLPGPSSGQEAILFTVLAGPLKNYTRLNDIELNETSESRNVLDSALKLAGIAVTIPSEDEFASAIPEAHRKSEKAYHVKAFRGSKDGFLFFLSTGVFFGFKKPLFFVALEDIETVSYTSVLQRTFNMVISYREQGKGGGEEVKEVEFSMLDQADYSGINGYVQKHGLNDASLAEGRRAKVLAKQKPKAEANGVAVSGADAEEDDGRTELEKAEAELQDEEDEMEEDFELESGEGESDGSGESGDDDEYNEEGGDLVKEELGSEAEDVSTDEEEAEQGDAREEDEEEGEEELVKEVEPPVQRAVVFPSKRADEPDPDDEDQL